MTAASIVKPSSILTILLNYTGVLLRLYLIIYTDQQNISLIFFQASAVFFSFNLLYRPLGIPVPF